MSFDERIEEIISVSEAMKLNVLIWGPGKTASEQYAKRQKIRQKIKDVFVNADVRFSEDLMNTIPGGSDGLTLPEQELLHLAACDICFVLDVSKGAGEEIAHFVNSGFGHKLVILTHEKYKDAPSFPVALRKYGNQLFFNDQEYERCYLVERIVSRVRFLAVGKLGHLFM
ncbi:MAG TPA: hypothetical protein VF290_11065 [Pyrinomonadaceae bacterium]